MKKDRKFKAIAVCLVLTLAYFWNYGITHPEILTEITVNGYTAAAKTLVNSLQVHQNHILGFIFKL